MAGLPAAGCGQLGFRGSRDGRLDRAAAVDGAPSTASAAASLVLSIDGDAGADRTVPPSGTRISLKVPDAGAGISTVALSVFTSTSASSRRTGRRRA